METKFIKIRNLIINANTISSIKIHAQSLIIECTNNTHSIYFTSDHEVEEELDRIYNILK
jgi:hypothetical protein